MTQQEKIKYLESEVAMWKGIAQSLREEEQKSELVLQLKPGPWRSEEELGEAGIAHEWAVINEKDETIGKFISWNNGRYGLFLVAQPRVELDGKCLSIRPKIRY